MWQPQTNENFTCCRITVSDEKWASTESQRENTEATDDVVNTLDSFTFTNQCCFGDSAATLNSKLTILGNTVTDEGGLQYMDGQGQLIVFSFPFYAAIVVIMFFIE